MKRERGIFEKALEFQDAESRRLYLDETCAGDLQLRRRIDDLLKQHDGTADFILDHDEIPVAVGRVLTRLDDWHELIPVGSAASKLDRLWTESQNSPDVFDFLTSQVDADELSNDEIVSIILVDQRFRWQTQAPFAVEDYIAALSTLQDDQEAIATLLLGEIRARGGDSTEVDIHEITQRFPKASEIVRSLLQSGVLTKHLTSEGAQQLDAELPQTKSIFSEERRGDRYFGRYRLAGILGQGGFGQVYLAYDTELQRKVAIKVPRRERLAGPEHADQYLAEARTVAKLDHANIVSVYDVGRLDDQSIFIVSKFIAGQTLGAKKREQPLERQVAWLAGAAHALAHAHENNIVHRDVKPSNILIEEETNNAFVADFGLAVSETKVDYSGAIVGTPAYMSPEQVRGEGHLLDGRSDIYSLGIVLYECLTERRPFQGSDTSEILYKVLHESPLSPRAVAPESPRELERICLKAISKRASERYATATEMARDLEEWLRQEDELSSVKQAVVPKGLQAFDENDSEFFLQLLPGPFNRSGLPNSLDFWKARIERPQESGRVRVGLIYGPSGSGKSSLLKAGLLPRLDRNIHVVCIDATATQTENQLKRALLRQTDEEDSRTELPDLAAKLRRQGKRVLIIIDQFEQWLHANPTQHQSPLINALRQCDGENLQSILLVRDDFWLATSRFMDTLEVELVQGHNFKLIDLFDRDHARSVLVRFGQAYGRLPEFPQDFSQDQLDFLEQAVEELADEGRVVSVRLTLFGEMVKSKPWGLATLKSLGGMDGVGQTFLNESFVLDSANPSHRVHLNAVENILRILLPELGSNIKGHMKSRSDLLAVSGYMAAPEQLDKVIDILVNEVRLISPAEEIDESQPEQIAKEKHYQLTHDFLVSAIRDWLGRRLRETKAGRAELKLQEHSRLWQQRPQRQYLPSLPDWISIRIHSASRNWGRKEQALMRATDRYYGWLFAGLAATVLVLSVGTVVVQRTVDQNRREAEAKQVVNGLLEVRTNAVPVFIQDRLNSFEIEAEDDLRVAFQESAPGSNAKLNAALAIANSNESAQRYLEEMLFFVEPSQFKTVATYLNPNDRTFAESLWSVTNTETASKDRRFRAACALAKLDPENPIWDEPEFCEKIIDQLVQARPSELTPWLDVLDPVKPKLIPSLLAVYRANDTQYQIAATDALLTWGPDNTGSLIEMILSATERSFQPVLHMLSKQGGTANQELRRSLDKILSKTELKKEDQGQAINAATALMFLGDFDSIWPMLGRSREPTLRHGIISSFHRLKGDPVALIKRYAIEQDVGVQSAIVLCVGSFQAQAIPGNDREGFLNRLKADFQTESDAELHSSIRWLLGQWDNSGEVQALEEIIAKSRNKDPSELPDQSWFLGPDQQTYTVVETQDFLMGSPESEEPRTPLERQHLRLMQRKIAVAIHEVSKGQWRTFGEEATDMPFKASMEELDKSIPTDECAMVGMTWYDAARYCNWLSEKEGIPQDQWCYMPNDEGIYRAGMRAKEGCLDLAGYRMMTEAEWEYVARSGTRSATSVGSRLHILAEYGWYNVNAGRRTYPCGQKKPNALGIFDMFGNAYEWCHTIMGEYIIEDGEAPEIAGDFLIANNVECVQRGGGFLEGVENLRSAARNQNNPIRNGLANGFRICRTLVPED